MIKKLKDYSDRYKGELIFVLSNYTSPAVGLVAGVIAAAYIDPEDFGTIQALLLIGPYVGLLQLGTFNGLNRNLSFYKAQGDNDKVQDMVNASKHVANMVSIAGAIIALFVLFYNLYMNPVELIILLTCGALFLKLAFNPQNTHFDTTFRSGQEFKTLGKIKFAENSVNTLIGLLPMVMGYIGRIIYDSVKPLVGWFFRFRNQPYKATDKGKFEDIKELIQTGFPLLLGGYILQLFLIADQSVIALFLGKEELGYYVLSKLIILAIPIIPQSLSIILYPKASARYGKLKDNSILKSFFWKALLLNLVVLIPLCILIYFIIEPVTLWLMPKYEPGIVAAKINILTCLTFVSNGPSIIVGVVKRNLPIILANALALLIVWGVGFWLIESQNLNIEGIAWLRFAVALLLSLFTIGYAYFLTTINEFNQ
jgi:O-antigen/teichoic acid export membrane protein